MRARVHQVQSLAVERTRLHAEMDCLRRENAELGALRLQTQELAKVGALGGAGGEECAEAHRAHRKIACGTGSSRPP